MIDPNLSLLTPVQFDLWPFIKSIDVFGPLLYITSDIVFVVCACFLPVILIPFPSNTFT